MLKIEKRTRNESPWNWTSLKNDNLIVSRLEFNSVNWHFGRSHLKRVKFGLWQSGRQGGQGDCVLLSLGFIFNIFYLQFFLWAFARFAQWQPLFYLGVKAHVHVWVAARMDAPLFVCVCVCEWMKLERTLVLFLNATQNNNGRSNNNNNRTTAGAATTGATTIVA